MKYTESITYDLKYRFKSHPHIQVDKNGNIFNVKTGRSKRLTINGRSTGLWLDSRTFVSKKNLNGLLEKVPQLDFTTLLS